jgi:hypothetical protein
MRLAAEADQQAKKTADLEDSEHFQSIAKSWRKLAKEVEINELGLR